MPVWHRIARLVPVLALAGGLAACGGHRAAPGAAATPAASPPAAEREAGGGARAPRDLRRALDEELDRQVRQAGVPGAASALVISGHVVWRGGAGMADLRAHRAMTARTPVWFASVSKTVTAAVALRLVEQRRLRLDDAVRRWVPEWRGPRRVTVRDLLNQTSGLRDPGDTFWRRQIRDTSHRFSPRDWLASTPAPDPEAMGEPTYANVNFILAGLVIRRAAGAEWAAIRHEVARDLVLQPDERVPGRPARFYVSRGAEETPYGDGSAYLPSTSVATAAWTAGAWAGTVTALAAWADRLFGGRILSRSSLAEMTAFRRGAALWGEYGLGVSRMHEEGYEVWGHSGDGPGLHSELWHLPVRRLTLFTVWNDDAIDEPGIQRSLLRVALAHG